MIGLFTDDKMWFRPKSFGWGVGLPLTWQGWLMMVTHVALILGIVALLRNAPLAMFGTALTVTLLPLPLYASRTEGGIHWRWGLGK